MEQPATIRIFVLSFPARFLGIPLASLSRLESWCAVSVFRPNEGQSVANLFRQPQHSPAQVNVWPRQPFKMDAGTGRYKRRPPFPSPGCVFECVCTSKESEEKKNNGLTAGKLFHHVWGSDSDQLICSLALPLADGVEKRQHFHCFGPVLCDKNFPFIVCVRENESSTLMTRCCAQKRTTQLSFKKRNKLNGNDLFKHHADP